MDDDHHTAVTSFSGWYVAKTITAELDLGQAWQVERIIVWSSGHDQARSFINFYRIWSQAGPGAPWVPCGEVWNPIWPGEIPAPHYPIVSPPLSAQATRLRLELNGVAQSADRMQVAEIEVWARPCQQPVAARPWCVKQPVPPIEPIPLRALAPAFDWIQRDRLRALYGYVGQWHDADLLDRVAAAGFNCLLVHTMGASHRDAAWPEEVAHWKQVQQERNLRIIFSWPYGSDERYGNTQFGAYQPGGPLPWTRTPCPLSQQYWDRVVGDRAAVAAAAGITGMVVDVEMYSADAASYPGPCYCDHCWGQFVEQHLAGVNAAEVPLTDRPAWTAANGLNADYARWQELQVTAILRAIERRVHAVNPDFILGNLLAPEAIPGLARGLGTPTMPALIFSELEYHGAVASTPDRIKHLREAGYPALYVVGLWIKPVTPPQLPDLVANTVPLCAGYWIWSSAAFSPEATDDYAHAPGFSHDDYWQAFRAANDALTAALQTSAR